MLGVIKLGPKTKEIELRLGLPKDNELDSGLNISRLSQIPGVESLNNEAMEPPRLDFSMQRGKTNECGPQLDLIMQRDSCYVSCQVCQEILGYNFVFLKKGMNSVNEAIQAKLEVSLVEMSNISSLKDLRSPLQLGADDSRFTHGGEAQN